MRVVVEAGALADIERIDAWWRENRPVAPELFASEVAQVLSLLARAPKFGKRYPRRGMPSLRRALLRESRQHFYYVCDAETVTVLAVWGALKRHGPPLPR